MKDLELENQIIEIARNMKIAINSYKTSDYQKLSIDMYGKMEEYFLNEDKS